VWLWHQATLRVVDAAAHLVEAVRAADRGEALLPWQLVATP
jgi:hypothetical protein